MQTESSPSIGHTSDAGQMSEHGHNQTQSKLMSSAVGSRAKTSARLERKRASRVSEAGYGSSLRESFAFLDRKSSSWRTRQRSLTGGWMLFSGTWPRSGLMLNGTCYRRAPLVPRMHEKECFSLPTLTVVSCEHPGRQQIKEHQQDCISGALSRRDEWGPGGQYSPSHAAWFMGFPESWTDLGHTETPSSHKSQNGSEIES